MIQPTEEAHEVCSSWSHARRHRTAYLGSADPGLSADTVSAHGTSGERRQA